MAGLFSQSIISKREDDFAARVSVWHQFRALFLKNATLQLRSIGTNICQLLTPIIFLLFAGLLQVIVNSILSTNGVVLPGTGASFFPPNNPGRLMACSYDNASSAPHNAEECRHEIFNFFLEFPEWNKTLDVIENVLPLIFKEYNVSKAVMNDTEVELEIVREGLKNLSDLSFLPCQQALFDLPLYYIGKSKGVNLTLGNLTRETANGSSTTNRTGFVGGMAPDSWLYQFTLDFKIHSENFSQTDDDTCPVNDGPYVQLPMFVEAENVSTLNDQLIKIVQDYNFHANKSSGAHDQYHRNYYVSPLSAYQYVTVMNYIKNIHNSSSLDKIKPQGGIFVDDYQSSGSEVNLSYTMVADDLVLYAFDLPKDASVSGFKAKIDVEVNRRNGIVNMMSNALFKHLLGDNGTSLGDDVVIATYIMPLPTQPMPITIDITSILGGLLYPFALSFLIPVFMSSLVKDKFEKHLIMMEQNGLGRLTYWTVSYLFNYMLYIPIAVEIVIVSLAFQIRLFTQTDGLILLLMLLVWGHTVVVLGFFFSTFFNRPRTATFVGYLIVVASVVVGALLETLQVFPPDETPFFLYMMYPIFAFCRLFQYLNLGCLAMQCYGMDTLAPQSGGGLSLVATAMVYLAGSTVLLMLLSVYFSFVLPSSYGVRKSPFFPIIAVYRWTKTLCGKCGLVACKKDNHELRVTSDVSVNLDEVDEDVQAEEDTLRRGFPDDAPVVMYQLRKEYPSSIGQRPYVAVHSVSLAIQRNECFGLLGPNGAGKTTLISVLTGLYEPTSGQARIAGYNIATDINSVHGHMGVCPQFDIQHASLTAEEHLLFYARLKGVKRSRETVVVERALRQVNLWDARKRKSCKLSGGMRRRLSVAMAMVGNPDILILDEPTTGLDPASRRQVWEVIETVKEGRSVILTTHAMEEADHLCTRIGIMNFGRLRCLGSETRLKAKFGTGYQLTFNCAPGRVGDVEHYLDTHIPRAVHLETYADSCSYKLDKGALKVSEVFQLLDSVKAQVGILDWGIKMTTLEDVFLNIVKDTEDDRIPPPGLHMPNWLPCQHCCRKTGSDTE